MSFLVGGGGFSSSFPDCAMVVSVSRGISSWVVRSRRIDSRPNARRDSNSQVNSGVYRGLPAWRGTQNPTNRIPSKNQILTSPADFDPAICGVSHTPFP